MSTDIIVMHAQNPTWGRDPQPAFPDDYRIVAVVSHDAAEALSDEQLASYAFSETNHIDQAWWENDSVTLQQESRSTSVGDVVKLPNGHILRCTSFGWTRLSPVGAGTPVHNNPHVTPVEGMTFLGTYPDKRETYDVYFIHRADGFHAVTVVWGEAEWQWESDSIHRIRGGDGVHAGGCGPFHYGLIAATERGLLT